MSTNECPPLDLAKCGFCHSHPAVSSVNGGLLRDILLVGLVAAGARAPFASHLAGTTIERARKFYQEVNGGKASASGQFPSSLYQFMQNPVNPAEATVFLLQWQAWQDVVVPAMRLVLAYQDYLSKRTSHQLIGEPLPIERCHLISASWITSKKKIGLVNGGDFYPWSHCHRCGKPHISSKPMSMSLCPWCRGSVTVSARLRGRAGRKGKGRADS